MNSYTDLELWALIKDGNAKAFGALCDRYWEKAYKRFYWHTYEQDMAKDLVQDLFVHLWEKREHIAIKDTVEGYLNMAIRNRFLNHVRSNKIRQEHYRAIGKKMEVNNSLEELVEERELRRLYYSEQQKLPMKMKAVFDLKENGMSIRQISEHLSLSEQTVKNQISSALKKIRTALEQQLSVWFFFFVCLYFCYLFF